MSLAEKPCSAFVLGLAAVASMHHLRPELLLTNPPMDVLEMSGACIDAEAAC